MVGVREIIWRGLPLCIVPGVTAPYSITEKLVDKAVEILRDKSKALILEIGTGCGNIGIALLKDLPAASVLATDISLKATSCAVANARANDVAERFVATEADGVVETFKGKYDLIIGNPPYLPKNLADTFGSDENWPRTALTDEGDGLSVYRRVIGHAAQLLKPRAALMLEYTVREKLIELIALFTSPLWKDVEILYAGNSLLGVKATV